MTTAISFVYPDYSEIISRRKADFDQEMKRLNYQPRKEVYYKLVEILRSANLPNEIKIHNGADLQITIHLLSTDRFETIFNKVVKPFAIAFDKKFDLPKRTVGYGYYLEVNWFWVGPEKEQELSFWTRLDFDIPINGCADVKVSHEPVVYHSHNVVLELQF